MPAKPSPYAGRDSFELIKLLTERDQELQKLRVKLYDAERAIDRYQKKLKKKRASKARKHIKRRSKTSLLGGKVEDPKTAKDTKRRKTWESKQAKGSFT